MTSNRRLSGAVALGLSVALTGAFAAPSFAAPAEGATVESSTFVTTTIEGTRYGQLTEVYSDDTEIVTIFTDADGNKKVGENEDILRITETSSDGTVTVTETDEDGNEVVTITEEDGTETVIVTEEDGTETETVTDADGSKTETITKVEENVTVGGKTGTRETVTVTEWDEDEDFVSKEKTETFTSTETNVESVTVTDAEGNVTETVTTTERDTVTEVVTEFDANGNETARFTETWKEDEVVRTGVREYDDEGNILTTTIREAGEDGELGTDDDIVTITETENDGTIIKTVTVDGEIISRGEVEEHVEVNDETEEPTEPEAPTFTDNPEGSAFYASVQWMAENGISVGYADGTYKKNKDVSRGETTQFLYKYEDPEFTAPTTSPFSDVNVGGAFFTPITWASSEGITAGFADGTFKPSQSVTRAQFAAFLYGLEDPEFTAPTTSPFGDINVGGGHYDAITWLASEEITVGDTQGNFNPSDEITRGQISAFMKGYAENVDAE